MSGAAGLAVLVTRAAPGCAETAERLEALGYRAIVSPAIGLAPVSPPPALPSGPLQGVVFTSANGVRAYAALTGRRDELALCVGPATDAAAEAAGFERRVNADGNADDLARLIVETLEPGDGPLLHVANTAAGGALVAALREAGFDAGFAGLYAPVPAGELSVEAAEALTGGAVAAVLFHSARGADAFARLVAGLDLAGTAAVAVSDKALAPVSGLRWRCTAVAARPNETALLAALAAAIGPV